MGNDLYAPHGTANRNGRSPATRAARELRDVRGRGGDRGPRRGPLGCLGGVRLAAALGRRCRRGLHRGRECPQRCVRPGNGPGEPSGTPAPRREGERRRGEVDRQTLPHRIGSRRAGLVAAISLFVGVALSLVPLALGVLSLGYAILVVPADGMFIYAALHSAANPARSQRVAKYGMIVALAAFLAGAFV